MSDLLQKHHLTLQINEVKTLLRDAREANDVVAELNLQTRLEVLLDDLAAVEAKDAKVGEIALLFDGKPVLGQNSINADFAAKAISIFQDIVTKLFASGRHTGALSTRGKIPGAEIAGLRITGIARGSFGFVLEENTSEQSSIVKTQVREALEEATEVFNELTQEDDDSFLIEIDEIDPRVFNSLTQFFKHLENNEAEFKASLPDRTYVFDRIGISRGFRRLSEANARIEVETWRGKLVGLSPIKRTFDFLREEDKEFVSGKFGEQISQDYLERIEKEGDVVLGSRFIATIEVATLRKPNGVISTSYTAVDLSELEDT